MSAERLREAAKVLRERAEAIPEWNITSGHLWATDYDPSDPTGQTAMQRPVGGADEPWAALIATMSPIVALALADWLEADATLLQPGISIEDDQTLRHAGRVADAILGGAA